METERDVRELAVGVAQAPRSASPLRAPAAVAPVAGRGAQELALHVCLRDTYSKPLE